MYILKVNYEKKFDSFINYEGMRGESAINVLRLSLIVFLAVTEAVDFFWGDQLPSEIIAVVAGSAWLWISFALALFLLINRKHVYRHWFRYAIPVMDAFCVAHVSLSVREDIYAGADAFFYFLIAVSVLRYDRKAVWVSTGATAAAYYVAILYAAKYHLGVYTTTQILINMGAMLLFGVLCAYSTRATLATARKFITDALYMEKLENAFSKYIPSQVASRIILDRADFEKAGRGHSAQSAVLIADIRGFTKMAQTLSPQELMDVLNGHFSSLGEIVYANGGMINKFVGDSIIAVFGDPVRQENPCLAAVKCAGEIVRAVNEKNAAGRLPSLNVGVGVNFGEIVAGNLGSDDRIEYAVLGDTVNMTERIQTNAAGGEVLVSESVHSCVSSLFSFEPVVRQLKGYDEPIRLYRLKG